MIPLFKNDRWVWLGLLDTEDPIIGEAVVEAVAANTIEIRIILRGNIGSIEPAIEAIPSFLDVYSENIAATAQVRGEAA